MESAQRNSLKEPSATWQAVAAVREAYFGNRERALQEATAALAVSFRPECATAGGLAFALAGDAARAQAVAADWPSATRRIFSSAHTTSLPSVLSSN